MCYDATIDHHFKEFFEAHTNISQEQLVDYVSLMISPVGRGHKIKSSVRPSLIRVKNTINKYSTSRVKRLLTDKYFASVFSHLCNSG
jgi:hypothetical protein